MTSDIMLSKANKSTSGLQEICGNRRARHYWFLLAAVLVSACGGRGSGGGGGGTNSTLKPPAYTVFKVGQEATLSGAGAMSGRTASGGTLSLGADGNSTLAVTDAATFAMTASNTDYQIVNRRNGAVVMLCDPLPAGGNPGGTLARYVAFATNSATADTQGTPVTNAAELAGKSFYEINECSYVNDDLSSQQQSSAPTGGTLEYRADASGKLRGGNGLVFDAATMTGFLNGAPSVDGQGRKFWFSAYKFTVGGEQKIYFAIRGEPNKDANGAAIDQGFVALWTDDPGSDVVGCSLNCAQPADAVAVTNPASVAGVYVTEFGFGEGVAAIWVNSIGNYSNGLGLLTSSPIFTTGFEFGTFSFDGAGNASAIKLYDTSGTGEAGQWSANATQLVITPVADPSRHFILQRVAKDPANLLLGAWALATCGATTGFNTTDPTQAFSIVYLKSGRYVVLDSNGQGNNPSPIQGVEYGTYSQDSTAGTFRYTGNLYDTNAETGSWSPAQSAPFGSEYSYSISADGDTLSLSAAGDICGNATLTRIN